MSRLGALGLRARLAIALVGLVALAVGLATLLSSRGLEPRVSAAAKARLERSAERAARVVATVYEEEGGVTPRLRADLDHLAALSGLSVELLPPGAPPPAEGASEAVVVSGRMIGTVVVSPSEGSLLSEEEADLERSLDRLHLAAGAIAAAAALVLAFLLAETLSRPLRRIRAAAERIERGDLSARVEAGGGPEIQAVAHALNRLAQTLEHEEELRRESVADLAHELRTPVAGLLSRIEAAQDGVLGDEAANLEAMHEEALRLTRLLDDLARLAEAERPGLLVEKRPVDLAGVAAREAEAFGPQLAEKGLELTTELSPVGVLGDRDRLGQIAANLLSNALRYTEPGGKVWLRVYREGDDAVLEVEDTGVGIAPEDLSHVFTRFWRGEKSRSRSTGGAGIGLAIVRELVRAHEGRVEVESEPGEGSTFRVRLPAGSDR